MGILSTWRKFYSKLNPDAGGAAVRERGEIKTELKVTGKTKQNGTQIRFKPDSEIFPTSIAMNQSILGSP